MTSDRWSGFWRLLRLVALAVAIFVAVAVNYPLMRQHWFAHQEGTVNIHLALEGVSEKMSIEEIRRVMAPVALECNLEARIAHRRITEQTCYAMIKSFKGMPALMIAFFFKQNQLAGLKVDFPWWRHWGMARLLLSQYGPPTAVVMPTFSETLVGWHLPGGILFYAVSPGWNPVQWTTAYWMSNEEQDRLRDQEKAARTGVR